MATIVQNQDGSLTVQLNQVELDTLSGLPAQQLENYITLWLGERATQVFQERFGKLSPQDQGEVLQKFRDAGKPADDPKEPTPIVANPEPPGPEPPDPTIPTFRGEPVKKKRGEARRGSVVAKRRKKK